MGRPKWEVGPNLTKILVTISVSFPGSEALAKYWSAPELEHLSLWADEP